MTGEHDKDYMVIAQTGTEKSALVTIDDRRVFIYLGSDIAGLLLEAAFDGVDIATVDNKTYFPIDWLRETGTLGIEHTKLGVVGNERSKALQ
jgi:hypothetical protein